MDGKITVKDEEDNEKFRLGEMLYKLVIYKLPNHLMSLGYMTPEQWVSTLRSIEDRVSFFA